MVDGGWWMVDGGWWWMVVVDGGGGGGGGGVKTGCTAGLAHDVAHSDRSSVSKIL